MANNKLREKADKLRRAGWGIKEIARELNASPSTVSYWCRDIILTKPQVERLVQKSKTEGVKALLRLAERSRSERIIRVEKQMQLGKKDIGRVSRRDLFITGLALYWGEGYRKGNEELGFTNSDPRIIKIIIKWLGLIYEVPLSDLIFRVSLNQVYRNEIADVEKSWAKLLDVSINQFTKASIINAPIHKTYPSRGSYLGTLRVKVRRGVALRRRILGSIDALASFC